MVGVLVWVSGAIGTGPGPFEQEIPAAAFRFTMVPIPGSADGSVKPFYMSATEVRWEAFDVFVYRLELPDAERAAGSSAADATTRPSKPYLPPDRGFGHEGFAAISMSFKSAQAFCVWLSEQSGRKYRLATEAEWEHAARAGSLSAYGPAADASALPEFAVYDANSGDAPKPVASKAANAWGLYDMLGNVREWVVGDDGKPVTKGGSYRDPAEELEVDDRHPQTPAWNASDPQIPKSRWWLSDGPFIGFRIVCEMENGQPAAHAPSAGPNDKDTQTEERP